MKKTILALMVATAVASPVYASDDVNSELAGIIAESAQQGADIGVICALDSAADVSNGMAAQDAHVRLVECVKTHLDSANLGPTTAIHLVYRAESAQ